MGPVALEIKNSGNREGLRHLGGAQSQVLLDQTGQLPSESSSVMTTARMGRWPPNVLRQGRQGLARIQDAVRIELALDTVHEAQHDGVQLQVDIIALGQAHPMLAR